MDDIHSVSYLGCLAHSGCQRSGLVLCVALGVCMRGGLLSWGWIPWQSCRGLFFSLSCVGSWLWVGWKWPWICGAVGHGEEREWADPVGSFRLRSLHFSFT